MRISSSPRQYGLYIIVGILMIGAPITHAQMLSDTETADRMTSPLLQTTRKRHARRHMSSDPYMALIAQSEPDDYLHEPASGMDPLGRASQSMLAVGKNGLNGGTSGALQARVSGARSVGGMGDLNGEMHLPGAAPTTDQALAIGIGSGVPAYTLTPRGLGTGCFALQQAMASCH